MRTLVEPHPAPGPRSRLGVFLPGAYDQPEEFRTQGFVLALQRRVPGIDAMLVDSHLGYYQAANVAERLAEDVIGPARAAGYSDIWLVGISLGGLGAMLHASRFPGIRGIVAIAPFVGTRESFAEVRRAGGLAAWQPPAPVSDTDWERGVILWLRGYARAAPGRPPLFLGYGRSDRFADTLSLVAPVLPPEQVVTVEGGHDWDTWRALWDRLLDRAGSAMTGNAPVSTEAG